MPTFIFSPGVKVYISSSIAGVGLVDVSDDLTSGQMVRRSDGVSTFNFALNNPQRKYDSLFTPNDRVVVIMKRLTWLRTFTGLLNSVPLLSAWPAVVNLSSSCSLKRLQYWYWDANLETTQQMIAQAMAGGATGDGGIVKTIITILDKVVGWPASKIHIGAIPPNWFDIAKQIAQQVATMAGESDALAKELGVALVAHGVVAGQTGTSGTSNGTLTAGSFGGTALSAAQTTIAATIIGVGKRMGMTDKDLVVAIAVAMQESRMANLNYGDRDSVGVFQQRPSQGWGTKEECMDVTHAATRFFAGLKAVPYREAMSVTQAAQAVQRSGFPDAYAKWEATGTAAVQAYNASGTLKGASPNNASSVVSDHNASSPPTSSSTTTPGASSTPGGTAGQTTGYHIAQTALDFVTQYPNIKYGPSASLASITQNPPPELDCSSFVQAIVLRATGGLQGLPRTTWSQIAWLQSRGAKKIPLDQALTIAGCFIYMNGDGHVEISLGTGSKTDGLVGAHQPGSPASRDGYYSNDGYGLEMPGMTFTSSSGVTSSSATSTDPGASGSADPTTASTLASYNANDPIDQLFGPLPWLVDSTSSAATSLANALVGVRALMNDQPLLPYLKNLFTATMRSFCSAPNGDLIAWLPDYYGIWGTAGVVVIEEIELQNFTIDWSDDYFVTHQFTVASKVGGVTLDAATGSIANSALFTADGGMIQTETVGIASIDISAIMYALFGINSTPEESAVFADYIYRRFGARPAYQDMPGIQGPQAEFWSALYLFTRAWAAQYNCDIPITFMPEIYPGMLVQIPAYDFQAYVTSVSHSFSFGDGGGFKTTLNVMAPAHLAGNSKNHENLLVGLPKAGNFHPGVVSVGAVNLLPSDYTNN